MTEQLQNALQELEEAGALMVPETSEIEAATDGAEWSGESEPMGTWKLIKHHTESYTTHTDNGV